jgi:hypothetical protein
VLDMRSRTQRFNLVHALQERSWVSLLDRRDVAVSARHMTAGHLSIFSGATFARLFPRPFRSN